MRYPKTFAAAKRAEKGQWAIGDALLEEIGPPRRGQEAKFRECADELNAAGMPYAVKTLVDLRNFAHKFDSDRRRSTTGAVVGIEYARAAGTPAVLRKAEKVAEETGKPFTKRLVATVRKATAHQDRLDRGRPMPERRKPLPVADRPVSEIGRMTDVLELTTMTNKATQMGRKVLGALAAVGDLTPDEREELESDVQRVIRTWQVVAAQVQNPIADQIEAFLANQPGD